MIRTLQYALIAIASITGSTRFYAQTPSADAQKVTVRFAAEVAGSPFACGQTYHGVGLSKNRITPQDLRFYVSKAELLAEDGTAYPIKLDQDDLWQYKNLAMLDFEDGTGSCRNGNSGLNAVMTGSVPKGHYAGLRFTIGVPFELDHIDATTAPSPLNMTAMMWSWQGGYRFVRAEVELLGAKRSRPAARPSAEDQSMLAMMGMGSSGFPVHIGSTGCASASGTTPPTKECAHPNRSTITLSNFDVSKDVVVFDLAALLKNVDLSGGTPQRFPGCMSFENNESCRPVMQALGLPFGNLSAQSQAVFSTRKAVPDSAVSSPILPAVGTIQQAGTR